MLETLAPNWIEPRSKASSAYTLVQPDQATVPSPLRDQRGQPDVAAIVTALCLTEDDCLLHLGCDRGDLSQRLFPYVGGFLGVDRSASCVAEAQSSWARPGYRFTTASVAGYVATGTSPWRFTAVLCDGGFAHLTPGDVLATLRAISIRFSRVDRVFIGAADDATPHGYNLAALAKATDWRVADRTPDGEDAVNPAGTLLLRDEATPTPLASPGCSARQSRRSPRAQCRPA